MRGVKGVRSWGFGAWGRKIRLEFGAIGFTRRPQYPLIKEYTLNSRGLNIMT